MTPFEILGVPSNSAVPTAEKAYRKLAMKHHPDRAGGSKALFQEVKAAWERIEGGYRDEPRASGTSFHRGWSSPEAPQDTWRDADTWGYSFDDMFKKRPGTVWQGENEIVASVTLREAFGGFNMVIPRRVNGGLTQQCSVNIPPGTPHGYRGKYTLSDGSTATITTRINTGDFHLRGLADANDLFTAGMNIGDIELDHEIDALDLITGAWITVKDFLSEELKVRVPAGFNPLHRLKITKKGYYGWSTGAGSIYLYRQDMYLKLLPVFRKPADIEKQKIIDLYNSIQGMKDEG